MINNDIIEKIRVLKEELKNDGIIIIGITGSVARGEDTADSDIDIVYQIDNPNSFILKYGGFGSFTFLTERKQYLEKTLNKKVDFIALNGLNKVSKKYIVQDLVNV